MDMVKKKQSVTGKGERVGGTEMQPVVSFGPAGNRPVGVRSECCSSRPLMGDRIQAYADAQKLD
jgi:hypothetical protein